VDNYPKHTFISIFVSIIVLGIACALYSYFHQSANDKKIDSMVASVVNSTPIIKEVHISQDSSTLSTSTTELFSDTSDIRSRNFELLESKAITFGKALDIATRIGGLVGIRPALLLAISQEELLLEKTDMCYLTNIETGEGKRSSDGKVLQKTMKPDRDIKPFLDITKALGKDPMKTLITCPMSFGWGGAMGPADFIPSTWMLYKNKIEKITGKPSDPWNVDDAFLAMGLFLADTGAKSKTQKGEWKSAMVYFSGSVNSPYTWYADGAMKIADQIQSDIDSLR